MLAPRVFLCLVLAIACRSVETSGQPGKAAASVVVVDASPSSPSGTTRCREVVARAKDVVDGGARAVAFLALATGGTGTGGEPVTLASGTYWRERAAFEDQGGEASRARAFLLDIKSQCEARYKGQDSSPILAGVERALESVRVMARDFERQGAQVDITMHVHSDLREGADRDVIANLYPHGKRPPPPLPTLDTTGIVVRACGVNDHLGQDGANVAGVSVIWQTILPGLTITTACPSVEVP